MKIGANLELFQRFAKSAMDAGDEKRVAQYDASINQVRQTTTGDRAYALFRDSDAKEANKLTREKFMDALKAEFNGRPIPDSVEAALTRDPDDLFLSDKPLTARRITAILSAVGKAKEAPVAEESHDPAKSVDGVESAEQAAPSKDYCDTASACPLNRGTVRVSFSDALQGVLKEQIVRYLSSAKSAVKGVSLGGDVSLTSNPDGTINLKLPDVRMCPPIEANVPGGGMMLSMALGMVNSQLKSFMSQGDAAHLSIQLGATIKVGPYDPSTGKMTFTLDDVSLVHQPKDAEKEKEWSATFNKALGGLAKTAMRIPRGVVGTGEGKLLRCLKDGSFELDLRRVGRLGLGPFGFNESLAANLRDVAVGNNGIALRLGDNGPGQKPETTWRIGKNEANGASNMDVTIDPASLQTQLDKVLTRGLQRRIGVSFDHLAARMDSDGLLNVSLANLDLKRALHQTGHAKLLRFLGFEQMKDLSMKFRLGCDAKGKATVSLASLTGDKLTGVRGWIVRKVLSKMPGWSFVTKKIAEKTKGYDVGLATGSNGDIASVSVNPELFLPPQVKFLKLTALEAGPKGVRVAVDAKKTEQKKA